MAVYGQPNKWQCGPFALKHALLTVGQFAHEDDLAALAGSSEQDGTDEWQLQAAADEHGCDLLVVRRRREAAARRELEGWLARGVPVLLCLDQWDHWVTAAGFAGDTFVIFDSHFDDDVLRVLPWETLARRIAFRSRHLFGMLERRVYDLQPLVPRRSLGLRFRLTPDRVARLQRADDAEFGREWDRYARALLPLAAATEPERTGGTPIDPLLRAERRGLLQRVREAGSVEAERQLERLATVAGVYDLVTRAGAERHVLDRTAVILQRLVRPGRPVVQHPRRAIAAPPRTARVRGVRC